MHDVVIVGGGPAGLSAALVLGRCRRRVLVVDAGRPRNLQATAVHAYLTRDGVEPAELLRLGREELLRYAVEFRCAEAVGGRCLAEGRAFEIRLDDGSSATARKVLLATGVADRLPAVEGLAERYGHSVHHCPYCDGWERRDQCLAALGPGRDALALALSLRTWSQRVMVCTNGDHGDEDPRRAERLGLRLRRERVLRLEGPERQIERIVFESGPPEPCDAVFLGTGQYQRSELASALGCDLTDSGGYRTDIHQRTKTPGVFLAGDADRDVQFVIVAAAEGATAAVAINTELQREDRAEAPEP